MKNKTMSEDKANPRSTVILILFILITAAASVLGDSLDRDREVLLNLKKFLEKQNRVNRGRYSEWNRRSSNPCDWHGIFCSPDGSRVRGIDLSDSKISGEMFEDFSGLTELQHLDLSRNTLYGAIPDDLNSCRSLVYLNLSHNILRGELKLTGLISLEKLDLSTNRFHGELKHSFPAICNRLVVANLSMNNFIGRIDSYFDGCWNLQYLDLSSNKFTGNVWPGFARLLEFSVSENYVTGPIPASSFMQNCSLQVLDLSENKFHGEVPGEISSCKNLVILNLGGNNFSGPIPSELGSVSTLEGLLLGKNSFSRVIPESLLNMKKLAFLDLSKNNFGGQVQDIFGRFRQLKSLTLQGNSYTDGLYFSGIHKLTNISRLDLSYNNFSGPLPVEISQMLGLQFLILAYNQFTGAIPQEYGDLSQLQALDLSFNGLTGSIPPALGNLRSLLWLMLANNSLTGEIPSELGNCASLLWLNLANNQLSGRFPRELTTIGRNATPTFESNQHSDHMIAGPSECLVTKRMLTTDYSPFGFVYTIPNRKTCRSIWDRLLKGYGFFQVCIRGSPVRKILVSGYLQLSGNQLSGQVPPDIGKMKHLSALHLGYNKFNGKLPTEIGELPLLVLNISWNKFSEQIPLEIENMKCLQNLDLSHNNFSGTFPTNFNSLNELTNFNISFNPLIYGTIPDMGQLATFERDSYLGNPRLRSRLLKLDRPILPPSNLIRKAIKGPKPAEQVFPAQETEDRLWWKVLLVEYGCGMVFGMVMIYVSVRKVQPKWFVAKVEGMRQLKPDRPLKRNASTSRGVVRII
ncbi:hypothetical protein PTKIN_Ptkin06aG0071100 [Pterospermum kingtungense]